MYKRQELEAFDAEEGQDKVMALFWPKIKMKRGVRPIVRRYSKNQIKSYFLKIELSEMLIAISLPIERFYTGKWNGKKRVRPEQVFRKTRKEMMQGV